MIDLDPVNALLGLIALALAWRTARALASLYVTAQPDEWLLCIRDGRPIYAGVGVARLRRPGDVVVRFSSTLQRVGFAVEALSQERIATRIEGFIFWSVAPEGDAPFRAYSRLGIARLGAAAPGLRHPKHLLTSPQHKAFQQILSAVVQRHASTMTLGALVGRQDELVDGLTRRLRDVTADLGVAVDQVEVLAVRPVDVAVQTQLAVTETERLREQAEAVRRETEARVSTAQTAAETQQALERTRALSERGAAAHAAKLRELELARERGLTEEAHAMEVARARLAREREESEAGLERLRAEALAARDAELARAEALERKSPAVREHERQVLIAQKVAETLRVTDARWVSLGAQSPAASVGAMIAGVREVLDAAAASAQ